MPRSGGCAWVRAVPPRCRSNFPGLARCDHPVEIDEERIGVVRAGGSFRVVLDAENGELGVAEALDGVVVEIDLGDLGAGFFERLRIGGEAVVLRGDGDLAGFEILYWLIAATVAELEFERRAAEGVREHLVTQANPEYREVGDERGDGFVDVGESGGIAGAIRKKDGVGLMFADLLVGRGGREDLDLEAVVHELAINAVLGAVVERGDAEFFLGAPGAFIVVPTGR